MNSNNIHKKRILIIGITGMLGSEIFNQFSKKHSYLIKGTLRNKNDLDFFEDSLKKNIYLGINHNSISKLKKIIEEFHPEFVINCVGVVKQNYASNSPKNILPINSIFPHELAELSKNLHFNLIHFSTDCVFSGDKGSYKENDKTDAVDLYGLSKIIGEVKGNNICTIRTSMIGHELKNKQSLLEWFLAQTNDVGGYVDAYFSGLPTNEIARILDKFIIQKEMIHGIYHLSGKRISKYELLSLISNTYKTGIKVHKDTSLIIDRSLNSRKFQQITGYKPSNWKDLVQNMYANYKR